MVGRSPGHVMRFGFRDEGLDFRVWGLGFREFRVYNRSLGSLGLKGYGLGFRG